MDRTFRRETVFEMYKQAGLLQDEVKSYIAGKDSKKKFEKVNLSVPNGYVIWPGEQAIKPDGAVNIMFQVRGGSPGVYNNSSTNAIVVILEAGGMGSKENTEAFGSSSFFNQAIGSIIAQLKKKTGRSDIHLGKWGMASWSGGYGAIHKALAQGSFTKKPDYVGIFDGMHHGRPGEPRDSDMEVYKTLAEEAKNGKTTFVVTHTAVDPGDYVSSTDTSNWLVERMGMSRSPVNRWNGKSNAPANMAASGNFFIFGLYDQEEPYMIKDKSGNQKPNIPGTSGYQHIQAARSAGDYLPVWP